MKTAFRYGYFALTILSVCTHELAAMNWLRPYDVLVRPEIRWQNPFMVNMWAEKSVHPAFGFNKDGEKTNVLQIWNCDQDALAMLSGFDSSSPASQLLAQLGAVVDDGIRGHVVPCGSLNLDAYAAFGGYYKFHDYFWLAVYLPVMEMSLKRVGWYDKTQDITTSDFRVKEFLTGNLFTNVSELGGPCLLGWKRAGLGDMVAMIEWLKDYRQRRQVLKNVRLNWRVGVNIPTGVRTTPDFIETFPYGYGTWGVIFGGHLCVSFGNVLRFGADVTLTHLFGSTHCRRIKTAYDQNDLLLLASTPAYTDYGMVQQFSLYGQGYQVIRGLSLLLGYQFLQQGNSTLQLDSCDYSNAVANSALSLRNWAVHQAVGQVLYDFSQDYEDPRVITQIMLFTRVPFNGRRSAAFPTLGFTLSFDF